MHSKRLYFLSIVLFVVLALDIGTVNTSVLIQKYAIACLFGLIGALFIKIPILSLKFGGNSRIILLTICVLVLFYTLGWSCGSESFIIGHPLHILVRIFAGVFITAGFTILIYGIVVILKNIRDNF